MIALPPIFDLDDAASLEAADTQSGALRSAASAGAQVRATAAAVGEGLLDRLTDLRPRGVVIVAGAGRARRAAALTGALLAEHAGLPISVVAAAPPWVGPLDAVIVAGDDAGDPRLADAVDRAVRRGAEVVVTTPDEGPMRAASAGRAMLLPPRVAVLPHNTLLRHLAVMLAVLGRVDPQHCASIVGDLDRLADALDAEAVVGHPRNEVFHNPAKALAARMQGRRVVFAGDSPVTAELAAHACEVLLREAGLVAVAAELSDAVAAAPQFGAVAALADYDPLFHDEQLDGPAPRDPVRAFVFSVEADRRAAERRIALLPDADLVTAGGDELPERERLDQPAGSVGVTEQLATLIVRIEMAAAYTKLIGGPNAAQAGAVEAGL
jgi:hypothetical protein